MTKYRIVKRTNMDDTESYVIQRKGLFKWKDTCYDEPPFTFWATFPTYKRAVEVLGSHFNIYKNQEVVVSGNTVKSPLL